MMRVLPPDVVCTDELPAPALQIALASLLGVVLVGCAGIYPATNAVAAEEIRCPATLQTSQSAAGVVAAPWEAAQQGQSSRLLYLELYAGPWRDEQPVMVDETKNSPNRETLIWRLRGNPSAQGTWLVCTYQNTQVKLVRRLPDSITECAQVNSTDPKRVVKLLEHGCR